MKHKDSEVGLMSGVWRDYQGASSEAAGVVVFGVLIT